MLEGNEHANVSMGLEKGMGQNIRQNGGCDTQKKPDGC